MEQAFVNICAVHGRPMHYLSFKHCVYTFNQKQQARTEIHNFSIAQTLIYTQHQGMGSKAFRNLSFLSPQPTFAGSCVHTSVFIWIHSMLISLCSLSFSQLIFADSFLEICFSRSAICVCNHHSPHYIYHCVFHIFHILMLTLMAVFIKCGNI